MTALPAVNPRRNRTIPTKTRDMHRDKQIKILPSTVGSLVLVLATLNPLLERVAMSADPSYPIRDPRCSLPVLAPWFPGKDSNSGPGGYRDYIDMIAQSSDYTILDSAISRGVDLTEPMRQYIRQAAAYAKDKGIGLALNVYLAHGAVREFERAYPEEMQERVECREVDLAESGTVEVKGSGRLLRAYCYVRSNGAIDTETVEDITGSCAGQDVVTISCSKRTAGRKACLMFSSRIARPALFVPHATEHQEKRIQAAAELGCTGALIDEGGLGSGLLGNPGGNLYWYARPMADLYAKETGGRDLVRDYLLMWRGEKGREHERNAAVNRYMELILRGYVLVEDTFYRATKKHMGPDAFVGEHPTWYCFPNAAESMRHGMDWWAATRDYAQTDEATPYCIRTALSKKWPGPVWYNMYYASDPKAYEPLLWRYALAGGRLSWHPVFPLSRPEDRPGRTSAAQEPLLRGELMRGECRVRLLNYITKAPLDCPVAVIFGHPAAMNWTWSGYMHFGLGLAEEFWLTGYYADLIPTSEIHNGSLQIDEEGYVRYGKQRYSAVVLYHPQFDKQLTAEFFRKAARGSKTALFRIGDWTADFDGKPVDGNTILPKEMTPLAEDNIDRSRGDFAEAFYPAPPILFPCDQPVGRVIARLKEKKIQPQARAERYTAWYQIPHAGFESVQPPRRGLNRLVDGTRIYVAGANDTAGDAAEDVTWDFGPKGEPKTYGRGADDADGSPIRTRLDIDGHTVTAEAMGVLGVRLDRRGKVEAMAAGGLKSFKAGGMSIELPQRADVAIWQDDQGQMHGVLQDWPGPVPAALTAITDDWLRLGVPKPLAD